MKCRQVFTHEAASTVNWHYGMTAVGLHARNVMQLTSSTSTSCSTTLCSMRFSAPCSGSAAECSTTGAASSAPFAASSPGSAPASTSPAHHQCMQTVVPCYNTIECRQCTVEHTRGRCGCGSKLGFGNRPICHNGTAAQRLHAARASCEAYHNYTCTTETGRMAQEHAWPFASVMAFSACARHMNPAKPKPRDRPAGV